MERRKKKKGKKRYFKGGIIGYIQKILTMVIVTMAVAFILSLFLKVEFNKVLKIATLGIIGLGSLSLLGGTKITYSREYNYHKSMTGMTGNTKSDIDQLKDSHNFFVFMAITSGVLYIGTLLF